MLVDSATSATEISGGDHSRCRAASVVQGRKVIVHADRTFKHDAAVRAGSHGVLCVEEKEVGTVVVWVNEGVSDRKRSG